MRRYARVFFTAVVLLGGAFGLHRVSASQGVKARKARFEHCAVVIGSGYGDEGGKIYGYASVCNFFSSESRCESTRFPFVSVKGDTFPESVKMQTAASVISRLGSEGWELVGEGQSAVFGGSPEPRALYFKRAVD